MTIWNVRKELSITTSPVIDLIKDRGHDPEEFLQPAIEQLHSPLLMKDMGLGVARVHYAVAQQEPIRIFGDYDADGISSTYTMVKLLSEVTPHVSYAIPNRKDGYGFSKAMIDEAHRDGCKLLISCDNGITAVEQTEYAKSLGIDVIITDHHEPQGEIPNTIVINPKQHDCAYPFKHLAGVGVAWKFCQAVLEHLHPMGWVKSLELLDVVSIGTIADLVDLVGENRVIASLGLKQFNETKNIGLQQLLKAMELDLKPVTAHTVGFQIGPAFNATGRLITANEAVDMLLERSRLKAMRSAKFLAELNRERQELTKKYSEEAVLALQSNTDKVLLYINESIPEGIVGVVASRIKESLGKPVMVLTSDESGQFLKGSGRSIYQYNMFEALIKHRDQFIGFGGHAMACGFSITRASINFLIQEIQAECKLTDEDLIPRLNIDYDIYPELLSITFAEQLEQMQPFGKGNPKPIFQATDMKVVESKAIGQDGTHLKMKVAFAQDIYDCIGFGLYEKFESIAKANREEHLFLDIAFYPGINEWQGRRTLQLELTDIKPT